MMQTWQGEQKTHFDINKLQTPNLWNTAAAPTSEWSHGSQDFTSKLQINELVQRRPGKKDDI